MTLIATNQCPNCDADLTELSRLTNPPTFCLQCRFPIILIAGKYKLIRILGEGGFGTVYLAEHVRLKRNAERVVKLIKQEVFAKGGMEDRFFREVQVTSDLSQRNEHIVRIYDDFGDVPMLGHFYVMEYLQGEPLNRYLMDPQNTPPLAWTIEIFAQLCDAMQAAHEEGIIHRDLKPENILLIERRKNPYFVKVLDFGIAKPMEDSGRTDLNLTQGALGTPMYMPPEQAMNRPIDGRSDLYAMGIMLYEMLTGHHPFIPPGQEKKITALELMTSQLMHQPPSLRTLRPDLNIPETIEQVVLKTLAKQPDDRYQSVEEFWSALSQATPTEAKPSILASTRIESPPMPTPVPDFSKQDALRTTYAPAQKLSGDVAQLTPKEVSALPPTGEHISPEDAALPFASPSGSGNEQIIPPPLNPSQIWGHEDTKKSGGAWIWMVVLLLVVVGGAGLYAAGFFTSTPDNPPPQRERKILVRAKPHRAKPVQPAVPPAPVRPTPAQQELDAGNAPPNKDDDNNPALRDRPIVRKQPKVRKPRKQRSRKRRRRRKRVATHISPRREPPRQVKPRPVAPNNGCPPGQVRLRIHSCRQGGGRFVITIGDVEKRYRSRQKICVSKQAGEIGVEQPACRECIVRLNTQRSTMHLYLKDQNDKNRKLSQNYCRKR